LLLKKILGGLRKSYSCSVRGHKGGSYSVSNSRSAAQQFSVQSFGHQLGAGHFAFVFQLSHNHSHSPSSAHANQHSPKDTFPWARSCS